MIHAAVEVCRPGDVLVVTTTSPSTDGMFGELLATSLASRGVIGLVTGAGVRDIAELRGMGFRLWQRTTADPRHPQRLPPSGSGNEALSSIGSGPRPYASCGPTLPLERCVDRRTGRAAA